MRNIKPIIIFVLYIIGVLGIIFLDFRFSLAIILLISLAKKDLIWPFLLILPVIKTLNVPAEGVTFGKIYYIFILIFLFFFLFKRRANIFSYKINIALISFSIWCIMCFIISLIYNKKNLLLDKYTFKNFLNENISFISLIILSAMIITYFKNIDKLEIARILYLIRRLLPAGIISSCLYIIFFKSNIFETYNIMRNTIGIDDPNEVSCIMASLSLISFHNIIYNKRFLNFIYNLITIVLVAYVIAFKTISKSGAVILIIASLISFLLSKRELSFQNKSLFIKYTLIYCLIILFIITLIISSNIPERLFAPSYKYSVADYLTTGRNILWAIGIELIIKNPLIGYGPSDMIEMDEFLSFLGKPTVSHNLILSLIIQYGILGLFGFFSLLFITIKNLNINNKNHFIFVFSFLLLIFAGISLSWFKRDIIWILLGISNGISIEK